MKRLIKILVLMTAMAFGVQGYAADKVVSGKTKNAKAGSKATPPAAKPEAKVDTKVPDPSEAKGDLKSEPKAETTTGTAAGESANTAVTAVAPAPNQAEAQAEVNPQTTNNEPPVAKESSDKGVAPEKEAAPEKSKEDGRKWKLGPTAALTFPRVKEIGLEYKTGNGFFSFGLISGGFDTKPTADISAKFSNYELRGRWHPFAGSFFLGVGYGKQSIKIKATDEISSVPVSVNLDIDSNYMMPHLGWFSVWDIGLTMGFDIGMISPSGVTSKLTSDASTAAEGTTEYAKMKKDAEDAGDKLGKTSIPYMTLFKIGWLF